MELDARIEEDRDLSEQEKNDLNQVRAQAGLNRLRARTAEVKAEQERQLAEHAVADAEPVAAPAQRHHAADEEERAPALVERQPVNTSRMLRGSAPVTQRPRARVVHTQ